MRSYILVVLLLYSTAFIAQNCKNTLSGTVMDLHDSSKLAEATLIIAGLEISATTDLEGRYSFPNLCDSTYTLQVSHLYCATTSFTVKVTENTIKNFRLEHHLEELNQITLDGKSYLDKTHTLHENTISKEALEKHSHGSLGSVLKGISGVSSLDTGNTILKPLINGLHSSRVVIINNGVRMEDQEWGIEHAPNLDINSAGNITVIKGAGALQYGGDAIGGVVITEAAKVPVKDTLYGKTLFTGASNGRGTSLSSGLVKGTSKGWHGSVQGTIKKFGDFETPDYILSNTGVFERDLSIHLGWNRFNYGVEAYYSLVKNEIGILRASHLGSAQDQFAAIDSDQPLVINDFGYDINNPKQDVTHHLARLKAFKKIEKLGKLRVQYDGQSNRRKEFDIRRINNDKPSLDLLLTTHNIALDLDTQLPDEVQLKTGVIAGYQNNFANPDTGVRRLIPDYDSYTLGAYAILKYEWGDHWLLETGGRFDYTFMEVYKYYRTSFWELRNYDQAFSDLVILETGLQTLVHPELDFNNTSATFGITYSIDEHYKLFANYSLASRAPNPSELFSEGLHHSASRIEYGDLSFASENGHKFALTFQKTGEKFSYSISPFSNTVSNFKVIEPTELLQTIRGNFQVWEYRQTNAQLLGVDIDAAVALTKNLKFNHQFSLTKGYEQEQNQPLINMPPANTKNELVYLNPDFHDLRLALQSEYVFRQNEYPDTNFEIFIPETERNEQVDNSTPPEAYHLLNLNTNITLQQSNTSKLILGLSVTNIFNTKYRNYLNLLRNYADDVGRNVLVNLKINY